MGRSDYTVTPSLPTLPARERRERRKRAPALAPKTLARLAQQHPGAHCELQHRSPFELLVAVVLSAQTTDVAVNKTTPTLFAQFPDARALAAAEAKQVEPLVSSLGFFRMKSKALVGLARALVDRHGGEVPRTLDELVELPGVGRKTANVVLGVIWNTPEGVVVDTHVMRVSQRLGWTKNGDPARIERDLCSVLPMEEWDHASHVLIFHGRRCCFARKPACADCHVNDVCPAAFDAESVGRKPPRAARAVAAREAQPAPPARRPSERKTGERKTSPRKPPKTHAKTTGRRRTKASRRASPPKARSTRR